jgi:hypothetical protein
MNRTKRVRAVDAGFVAIASAALVLAVAPIATAQTMGEYGGVTGNAASSGVVAPKLDPSLPSPATREAGPSQSVEIRNDDSNPQSGDQQTNQKDEKSGKPSDDWTQVK